MTSARVTLTATGEPAQRDDVVARMGRLWREMRRGASTTVVRDRMFGVGPDAVEPGHMDILDLLHRSEPRRMSDLAAALRVDPSTVTRAVQRMEADGLAERIPDPIDGRGVAVRRTAEGTRRHALVDERRRVIIAQIMDALSAEERRQLVALLDRFMSAVDDYVRSGRDR